jgi:hypothetical protein
MTRSPSIVANHPEGSNWSIPHKREEEPQPDNPARLSPFTDSTQTGTQSQRSIFSRTRVQQHRLVKAQIQSLVEDGILGRYVGV